LGLKKHFDTWIDRMPNSAQYVHDLFALDGQVAAVIGATGTLGGAIAEGIAQAGASVVVAGRSAERGTERVKVIERLGGTAAYLEVDCSSRDSLKALLDGTLGRFGRVDILVNCAGVNSATPYEEINDEDWARVLDTNLTATHLGCQVFAPHLAANEHGGSILNIGSVTSHTPLSKVFAYSASKAAVVNLTKNLAREYAPKNVRINVLCPGFFPAEQNRKILTDQRRKCILEGTPMQRFGEPHELIAAVLLLVSPRAGSYITGTDLYVDGGFTAMRF
jgi:NAD(P)-dependent dehydrogenase (short-subunit alcohol dehydrogenase family)